MGKATELMTRYPIGESKVDESKVDPALTKLVAETDPDTIIKISRQIKRLNNEELEAFVEALKNYDTEDSEE